MHLMARSIQKKNQAFLESYAEHFGIVHRFRLNTKVTTVSRVGDKWSLLLTDAQGKREEEMFDRLVVCTGLFQTPKEPRVEGLDQFRGKILNAHTYERYEDACAQYDGQAVGSLIRSFLAQRVSMGSEYWLLDLALRLQTLPEVLLVEPIKFSYLTEMGV